MPTQFTTYRRETIDLFLRASLSDVEQTAFEEHLAMCSTCRDALSDNAAEPELWNEAVEALSDDALECGVSAPLWDDRDSGRINVAAHRTGRADFPHPALGQG